MDGYGHGGYAVRVPPSASLGVLLEDVVERVAERVVELLDERGRGRRHEPAGDLLSVAEAADVLRCKPQRVYDLRSAGRLPRTTEGGRAVVRRSDLHRLVGEVVR